MDRKSILIFGAFGFIATYLIDELVAQGHEVHASDYSEAGAKYFKGLGIPYTQLDISQRDQFDHLPQKRFDVVIHLAACQPANVSHQSYDPVDYVNTNVVGTLNILEFCRRSEAVKVIYATSHRNTQGLWAANKRIKESDGRAIKFRGEYAMFSISESAAQDCVQHYDDEYGLRGIIFRLPPVYGYGPHTEIFKEGKPIRTGFQVFIDCARQCRPLEVWGDPDIGRDIIYVKDVIAAFICAIGHEDARGLFNITSGVYLTLRDQAQIIADTFWGGSGTPQIVYKADVPNGMEAFVYDNSKAERELGWVPEYSFKDMLLDFEKEAASAKHHHLIAKRKSLFNQP